MWGWTRLGGAALVLAVAGCTAFPGTQDGDGQPVGADCGGGPVATASAPDTPQSRAARERVEAFISDYHRAWERSGRPGSTFQAWHAERSALAATHLVDEGAFALDEGGLGWPANHDPDREKVRTVSVDGDRARVQSRVDSSPERFYSYGLTTVGGTWRIERTTRTLVPPTAPVLDPQAHAALAGAVPPGTTVQGRPEPAPSGLEDLFAAPNAVVDLGSITTSGVLAVHDLGWVAHDLVPLAQRVPPGTYPVLLSRRTDGVTAALRVRLSAAPPTRWVAAARAGSDNQVIVDAGNVAVLDFTTMPRCRTERIEELYRDHVADGDGGVFSIAGGREDAVVVTAGLGDGTYPVYWGVTADGTVTDLLVDFLVG